MRRISTTKIVKIGNSRGIRIPKALLEQANLTDEVQLVLERGHIEVRPARKPREGWDEAFKEMHERGDDKLIDEPVPTSWEEEGWEW
jgi:antitoxin MazE